MDDLDALRAELAAARRAGAERTAAKAAHAQRLTLAKAMAERLRARGMDERKAVSRAAHRFGLRAYMVAGVPQKDWHRQERAA